MESNEERVPETISPALDGDIPPVSMTFGSFEEMDKYVNRNHPNMNRKSKSKWKSGPHNGEQRRWEYYCKRKGAPDYKDVSFR